MTRRTERFLETFSNEKGKLLARIGGIQKALEFDQTSNLIHLEGALKKNLEKVLTQEEIRWYQKSRKEWINCGD